MHKVKIMTKGHYTDIVAIPGFGKVRKYVCVVGIRTIYTSYVFGGIYYLPSLILFIIYKSRKKYLNNIIINGQLIFLTRATTASAQIYMQTVINT